ncbi:MAG: hypothetical protein ACRCU9_09865, partial [Iodobacter sp.]
MSKSIYLSVTLALTAALMTGCNSSDETAATPAVTPTPSPAPGPAPGPAPEPVPTLPPVPSNIPTLPPTPVPAPVPMPANATKKALLIGIDGLQYDVLLEALANKQLSTLAKLNLMPSYAGGVMGSATQQQTLSGPGWASILSGAWANRHEVRSDYAGQVLKTDSLFKQLNSAKATSISSWSTLNKLLRLDINTGLINNAVDCSGFDQCV